jgi:hypothetical protein
MANKKTTIPFRIEKNKHSFSIVFDESITVKNGEGFGYSGVMGENSIDITDVYFIGKKETNKENKK